MDQPFKVILHRLKEDKFGTHGEFKTEDGKHLCFTIELPWKNNAFEVSCIPLGEYQVIPHNSLEHPHTWEVTGVPNRTAILIHTGNTMADVLGCIAVGTFQSPEGVLLSKNAMAKLHEILPPNFVLDVFSEE